MQAAYFETLCHPNAEVIPNCWVPADVDFLSQNVKLASELLKRGPHIAREPPWAHRFGGEKS